MPVLFKPPLSLLLTKEFLLSLGTPCFVIDTYSLNTDLVTEEYMHRTINVDWRTRFRCTEVRFSSSCSKASEEPFWKSIEMLQRPLRVKSCRP